MDIFPATKVLPTYLFCFIVGPYEKLEVPVEKRYNVHFCLFRIFLWPFTVLSLFINILRNWHLLCLKSQFNLCDSLKASLDINLPSTNMIKFMFISINGELCKMQVLLHLMISISGKKKFQMKECLVLQTQSLMNLLIIGLEILLLCNGGMIFG